MTRPRGRHSPERTRSSVTTTSDSTTSSSVATTPLAIIDWDDDVAPGPRLLDVSHAVWCLAELGPQGGAVAAQARRVRLVADTYGRDDRLALIDALELRFRRALSDAERTRRAEPVRIWSREVEWLAAHRPDLDERLS